MVNKMSKAFQPNPFTGNNMYRNKSIGLGSEIRFYKVGFSDKTQQIEEPEILGKAEKYVKLIG